MTGQRENREGIFLGIRPSFTKPAFNGAHPAGVPRCTGCLRCFCSGGRYRALQLQRALSVRQGIWEGVGAKPFLNNKISKNYEVMEESAPTQK